MYIYVSIIFLVFFMFGCAGAPKPVQLENSAGISVNQGLLTEYSNVVPKDPLLSGNNWAYNLTARKQSDGELLKNSEVTKMFYFAHNADKIIIIGAKRIAKEYQEYFLENAVTALIEIQPVTDIKLKDNGVNILFFGNGKEKTTSKKSMVVQKEEPTIPQAQAIQEPLEITEVVAPIELPKIDDKPKVEIKPVLAPKNEVIPTLALQEQKPLKIVEQKTTIAPQEPPKEVKEPLAMLEEGKAIQTPKIDLNATKNETKVELLTTLPKETRKEVNEIKDTKNEIKTIEKVVVKDFPFMKEDINASIPQPKDLSLAETIEDALAVYPNFDNDKLREDLMRLVVKNSQIDAQSVKTMPLTKSLLLELLKIAKEKE